MQRTAHTQNGQQGAERINTRGEGSRVPLKPRVWLCSCCPSPSKEESSPRTWCVQGPFLKHSYLLPCRIPFSSYPGCLLACLLAYLFICLFVCLWLHWVFVAARGLSLVVASGGYSLLQCAGFSFLISVASLVAEHGL